MFGLFSNAIVMHYEMTVCNGKCFADYIMSCNNPCMYEMSVNLFVSVQVCCAVSACSHVPYVDLCSVRCDDMRNNGRAARYNGMHKTRCSDV